MTARERAWAWAGGLALVLACGDEVSSVGGSSSDGSGTSSESGASAASSSSEGSSSDGGADSSTGITPPGGECGNGVLELGEDCDDGRNGEQDDGCTDACALPQCGDGWLQPTLGEHCDAGRSGDAWCTSGCVATLSRTWLRELGSEEGDDDYANGVAVDDAGNVYAVGSLAAVGRGVNGRDIWVRKYDPRGNELWTQRYDSDVSSSFDEGQDIAVCPDGTVVVAGSVPVLGEGHDGIVLSYDADGFPGWTAAYQGEGGFDDSASAIGCTAQNLLVGGYGFDADGASVAWYNALALADGATLWGGTRTSASDNDYSDLADIAAGPEGQWAVSGTTDDDNWVAVLEPDGSMRWELVFDAISDAPDYATGAAFTTEGDLVVAGSTTHAYLRRFDPDGAEVWSAVYAGVEGSGHDVAVTSDGLLALVGSLSSLGSSGLTPAIFGVDPSDGTVVWVQLALDGAVNGSARRAAAGPGGVLALVGDESPHAFQGDDLWVARYAPSR